MYACMYIFVYDGTSSSFSPYAFTKRQGQEQQQEQASLPSAASSSAATDGTLGGGQTQDFPTARRRANEALQRTVWRSQGALEGLLHVRT